MQKINRARFIGSLCGAIWFMFSPALADKTTATQVFPKILLIRHGEKPKECQDDPKANDSKFPDLSPAGYARADKLAPYLEKKYGKADFIFAAKSSKTKRPVETITPYSKLIGVPIDSQYDNGDEPKLAGILLSDPKYAGKLVVICWRHEEMPQFAAALNAPVGTYPKKWDSKIYNVYLKFDYPNGNKVPKVTSITQPF
jgi:hypothetical protein